MIETISVPGPDTAKELMEVGQQIQSLVFWRHVGGSLEHW